MSELDFTITPASRGGRPAPAPRQDVHIASAEIEPGRTIELRNAIGGCPWCRATITIHVDPEGTTHVGNPRLDAHGRVVGSRPGSPHVCHEAIAAGCVHPGLVDHAGKVRGMA